MKENKLNYRPAYKSFIIEFKETTGSGIIVPEQMFIKQEDTSAVEIIAISDDCSFAKVGMMVVRKDNTNTIGLELQGKKYLQIAEGYILGEII
jgi:co-chaperonin GroES (HSP10)